MHTKEISELLICFLLIMLYNAKTIIGYVEIGKQAYLNNEANIENNIVRDKQSQYSRSFNELSFVNSLMQQLNDIKIKANENASVAPKTRNGLNANIRKIQSKISSL